MVYGGGGGGAGSGGVVVVVGVQCAVSVGVTQRSGQHVICVVKLVAHTKQHLVLYIATLGHIGPYYV